MKNEFIKAKINIQEEKLLEKLKNRFREENFCVCSAAAPAVGASHRRRERSRILIGFKSKVLISEKVILFVSGFRSGLERGIDGLVSVLVCFGSVGVWLGDGLVGFCAVVVRCSNRFQSH